MILLNEENCKIEYLKNWMSSDTQIIDDICNEVVWRKDKIKFFGKEFDQPRKVAWHGDKGVSYRYSGIDMQTGPWTPELKAIKQRLENEFQYKANSVLVNLYRNGQDYMSWHADNENELGENPIIISLSFGASRDFILKHRYNELREKIKVCLGHGDLLIMSGETQEKWLHALPKRMKVNEPRLNLTFRIIY